MIARRITETCPYCFLCHFDIRCPFSPSQNRLLDALESGEYQRPALPSRGSPQAQNLPKSTTLAFQKGGHQRPVSAPSVNRVATPWGSREPAYRNTSRRKVAKRPATASGASEQSKSEHGNHTVSNSELDTSLGDEAFPQNGSPQTVVSGVQDVAPKANVQTRSPQARHQFQDPDLAQDAALKAEKLGEQAPRSPGVIKRSATWAQPAKSRSSGGSPQERRERMEAIVRSKSEGSLQSRRSRSNLQEQPVIKEKHPRLRLSSAQRARSAMGCRPGPMYAQSEQIGEIPQDVFTMQVATRRKETRFVNVEPPRSMERLTMSSKEIR